MRKPLALVAVFLWMVGSAWSAGSGSGGGSYALLQSPGESSSRKPARGPAKPVTIPVSVRVRGSKPEPELQTIELAVTEDGQPQTVLSIRAMGTSPIMLEVLIQDDLVSSLSNEIKPIAEFIGNLPKGSRVLVGYVRTGTLEVRQKFTTDLEKAAKALRAPLGLASAAPFNPYIEVLEGINRFESQPSGRRALLLVSDGLDISRGVDSSSPTQSVDLQRAINQAQRRGAAVYAFYVPSITLAATNNQVLVGNAQSSLQRLSEETGGRAFFQGTGPPVSFAPFLRDLNSSLGRQIALTYLSTHPNKGFHRLEIRASLPGVELEYPAGFTR